MPLLNNNLEQFKSYLEDVNSIEFTIDESTYKKLLYIILTADAYYYKWDNPLLSDIEYDTLFNKLKSLEQEYPKWISPQSPTQRIYNAKRAELPSVTHLVPMLSLSNSYNAQDLIEWDKKNIEALGHNNFTYSIEPKYDGAGISCVYSDNILQVASTRGDGVTGEDITLNALSIPTIPSTIQEANQITFEVRGEVVIKKSDFDKVNQERLSENLNPFANPRNAASGSLRMLDPKEVKKRNLHVIMYHVSYTQAHKAQDWEQSHFATLQQLQKWGFTTPLHEAKVCNTIQEVIEYSAYIESIRDDMPYEIDGMVVKINESVYQEALGQTSHHPRWAMAIKFKARQATSTLLNVEFQVGRTGSITPVAKIKPVSVGGVTISSISLFNEENILQKDIMIHDTVLIERAGDVIPYIVKSIPELRPENALPIQFPTKCPVCDHQLFRPEGEAAWRCVNINCSAQVIERIKHFVSKDAMDIRSLGEANIKRFFELNYISKIIDIYNLPYDKISQLDKFGSKSVANLKDAIEKSKTQPLHRLIFALGIRHVGETMAKTIERSIQHSLFEIANWTIEDMLRLDDVGPKVAQSIHDFFKDPENIELLKNLEQNGVVLSKTIKEVEEGTHTLQNMTFLVTGTLQNYKRSELEALIEAKGGKILSGVSSKLNFLIVGSDAGSKLEKAKKLNTVKILNEEEILEMIK